MTDLDRDDAIVLAVMPGNLSHVMKRSGIVIGRWSERDIQNVLRRLKRAGKVRYVRETKQWEKTV